MRPWKPRRARVGEEDIEERASPDLVPVNADTLPEDEGPVALPEPPPPAPGDDLRLPNPEQWGSSAGLPVWFWLIGAAMIVLGTLWIVWDPPDNDLPDVPEELGEQ